MVIKKFKAYLIVGGASFLIDFAITLLLVPYLHYLWANTLGFLIANAFNFLAGHRYVFKRPWHLADMARAYPAVLSVSVIGLILSNVLMYVFIEQMAMDLIPAKIVTTALVLIWNFSARLRFIYKSS